MMASTFALRLINSGSWLVASVFAETSHQPLLTSSRPLSRLALSSPHQIQRAYAAGFPRKDDPGEAGSPVSAPVQVAPGTCTPAPVATARFAESVSGAEADLPATDDGANTRSSDSRCRFLHLLGGLAWSGCVPQ